jgi:general secretion pathway protein G
MKTRQLGRNNSGFTLVEILIVVIILGILAAIVIPQFTNASDSARQSSIQSQLQTIRSQIQLYKVQHLDNVPTTANMITTQWEALTSTSDQNATFPPANGQTALGPYLQQAPINPYNNSTTIAAAAGAGVGWVYDPATGNIQATDQNCALTAPIDGY